MRVPVDSIIMRCPGVPVMHPEAPAIKLELMESCTGSRGDCDDSLMHEPWHSAQNWRTGCDGRHDPHQQRVLDNHPAAAKKARHRGSPKP